MASANDHLEIADILLKKNIDINAKNESGNTALRNYLIHFLVIIFKKFEFNYKNKIIFRLGSNQWTKRYGKVII